MGLTNLSTKINCEEYKNYLNGYGLLSYYGQEGTKEQLTDDAINILKLREHERYLYYDYFANELNVKSDTERKIYILWNFLKFTQHLFRLFIQTDGDKYYNNLLKENNLLKGDSVSINKYCYEYKGCEIASEKLIEFVEQSKNNQDFRKLLQDESDEYPSKFLSDSKTMMEQFSRIIYHYNENEDNLSIDDCNGITKYMYNSFGKQHPFIYFSATIRNYKDLYNKVKNIIFSILIADKEKQEYIYNFPSKLNDTNNYQNNASIHKIIYENLLEKCSVHSHLSDKIHSTRELIRKFGANQSGGNQHTTAGPSQGGILGQPPHGSNWEYPQGSGYYSGSQQKIGQQSDYGIYGNQAFLGYQPGYGDYQHGYGHGSYSMGGDMGSQGGSEYHGEEDTDINEEGEFSD
uniref:Variable surface protein n=1 Tax=Meloidogyne hapla TaxID=6305 RepID=A0A1I8BTX8_MELHA